MLLNYKNRKILIMSEKKNLKEEYVPLKSRISVSGADGIVAFAQTIIGGGTLTYYFTTTRD
jgi:hypothetical protein